MMEAAALASWHSVGALTRKDRDCVCGFKAGREAAAALLMRAVTWLPGRTWIGSWVELAGVAEAEPVGPLSVCWGRVGVLDV